MAKNRKNQSAAVRFGPALKAFLLCVLIGGSGVGYVWQKSQIKQLGDQIKAREQRFAELEQQNQKLRDHLAMLRSPAQLKERVLKLNLGLAMPQPNQVWTLAEPVLTPPATVDAPAQSIASSSETGLAMH
jgi:cell division protein FtsB